MAERRMLEKMQKILTVRNELVREALAEALGTFLLMVRETACVVHVCAFAQVGMGPCMPAADMGISQSSRAQLSRQTLLTPAVLAGCYGLTLRRGLPCLAAEWAYCQGQRQKWRDQESSSSLGTKQRV